MKITNIFKDISREEKLRIFDDVVKIILQDVKTNDSNLCKTESGQESQSIETQKMLSRKVK